MPVSNAMQVSAAVLACQAPDRVLLGLVSWARVTFTVFAAMTPLCPLLTSLSVAHLSVRCPAFRRMSESAAAGPLQRGTAPPDCRSHDHLHLQSAPSPSPRDGRRGGLRRPMNMPPMRTARLAQVCNSSKGNRVDDPIKLSIAATIINKR
ncbi:hypothetical protein CHELA40_13407 [Chelatococcus asaccharovorans]|nr:hypothetical protein CHELA40_13407 [Chelatococcus asaccharovorans]